MNASCPPVPCGLVDFNALQTWMSSSALRAHEIWSHPMFLNASADPNGSRRAE